ncbi:MAG: rhodanese-like domain-containing protein [Thermodesulfobacteriota bacterium]|nr:rhodanese-like domain-containing protein [Thermodesulfobacteriota bacterium]
MLNITIEIYRFILRLVIGTKRTLLVGIMSTLYFICLSQAVAAAEVLTDDDKKRRIDELYEGYKKEFPGVAFFSADQTMQVMSRIKMILVDIREPEEQEVSMIDGAITEREFFGNYSIYQNHIVVAYCTIGSRSGKFVQKLSKKGISSFNLSGGILAWLHAGGAVHRDGTRVKRVHVYGKKWDLAPSTIETVW